MHYIFSNGVSINGDWMDIYFGIASGPVDHHVVNVSASFYLLSGQNQGSRFPVRESPDQLSP